MISTPSELAGGSRAGGSCAPVSDSKTHLAPASLGLCKLLAFPVRTGKTWTDSWNTGSPTGRVSPVIKCTIEARNDKIEVPAGRFSKCLRVRSQIQTSLRAGSSIDPDWQGANDGTRIDWYAPGVGLVKLEFHHANGKTTRVDLVGYEVRAAGESYFPNRVGNTWEYEWHDEGGKLLFREFWRLAAKKGKVSYLGFGAYECK